MIRHSLPYPHECCYLCGLWFVVGCSRLVCTAITHVSPSTPTAHPHQDKVVTEFTFE